VGEDGRENGREDRGKNENNNGGVEENEEEKGEVEEREGEFKEKSRGVRKKMGKGIENIEGREESRNLEKGLERLNREGKGG